MTNTEITTMKQKLVNARRHRFRPNWSGNSCEYRIKAAGYRARGEKVYEFCNQTASAAVHFQAKEGERKEGLKRMKGEGR